MIRGYSPWVAGFEWPKARRLFYIQRRQPSYTWHDRLLDAAFVQYDPSSSTDTFDPNLKDLTYSPALQALGAQNGLLPSLKAVGNDDELTRHQTIYIRGNVNNDAGVDISDAVDILGFLFLGGAEPDPMLAADANHDDRIDIADTVFLLNYLFYTGPAPGMPFPAAGQLMR